MADGVVLFRCDGCTKRLTLSVRDIGLLDAQYFLSGGPYRPLFALDFARGLGAPPTNVVLRTHRRQHLILSLKNLLLALEDQRDLIGYSYQHRFTAGPHAGQRGGGAISGFHVDGLHGCVDARPAGSCTAILSEVNPSGRGRVVQITDLRSRRNLETDDWGRLTVFRRKAKVGWFRQLPGVIRWLSHRKGSDVELFHV